MSPPELFLSSTGDSLQHSNCNHLETVVGSHAVKSLFGASPGAGSYYELKSSPPSSTFSNKPVLLILHYREHACVCGRVREQDTGHKGERRAPGVVENRGDWPGGVGKGVGETAPPEVGWGGE